MKENRSITKKNLLGGFLGGTCGILAFGYIHPVLLPLGVLMGVIVGWWYEAIHNAIVQSVLKGIKFGQHCRSFIEICARTSLRVLLRGKKRKGSSFAPVPINWFIVLFVWLLTRPIAYWKWFRAHPMNRAYTLRVLMVAVQALSFIAAAIVLTCWFMPETLGGGTSYDGKLIPIRLPAIIDYATPIFLSSLFPLIVVFAGFMASFGEGRKAFYKDFERYSSKGPVKYFFHHMGKSLLIQAKVYTFFVLSLIYFLGVGGLFISVFVIPLAAFIWTVKEVNNIVMRKGHWICLGTTMAVTVISAWIFHSYFENAHILWGIALSTGMASGALTEAIRRAIAWTFENTAVGRQYATAETTTFFKDRFSPKGKLVMRGWEKLIEDPLSIF